MTAFAFASLILVCVLCRIMWVAGFKDGVKNERAWQLEMRDKEKQQEYDAKKSAQLAVEEAQESVEPYLDRPLDSEWLDEYEEHIRKIIREGQETGNFRRIDPYNVLITIAAARNTLSHHPASAPTNGRKILGLTYSGWLEIRYSEGTWMHDDKPIEWFALWVNLPS